MKHEPDFSALRNLLALKKLDTPLETEVDRFLIEFHRRQRAQLLVPASRLGLTFDWLRAAVESLRLVPSLAGVGVAAGLALALVFGLGTPQAPKADAAGSYTLSYRMPGAQAAFAMVPTAFTKTPASTAAKNDNFSFTSATPSATRFILANPRVAYDATAAF
jgi:hypothetical protein